LNAQSLRLGLGCALGAGLLWGMVFIAPVLLPGYPAIYLSAARYLAFGLIALVLAIFDWKQLRSLSKADWLCALELSFIGNLLYYSFLAAAIQIAGAPLPTMIIGALPVVISICSNLHQASMPWRKLLGPLSLICLGIALVHRDEWNHLSGLSAVTGQAQSGLDTQFLMGGIFALAAVACWTWYPIRNSRWLKLRPNINSTTWANAQGLATLPLAFFAVVMIGLAQNGTIAQLVTGLSVSGTSLGWRPFHQVSEQTSIFEALLGPTPMLFLGLMLAIGLGASWLGTLLWNRASQVLPATLMGQLIVFETLAAMFYAFIHRGEWPGALTWAGIVLLIAGVVLGVRAFRMQIGEA
jgi:drug/metabolite transporter (DMT)-like permease